ncbi:hydrogenase expression/formation protein HypE [candidate division KSB1 bacterium]|nr:hydrogenase expression/formation protein HypE [candidate division KSB1 bacterium]
MHNDKILLDHGSGGRASQQLVSELILSYFENPILAELDDSAILDFEGGNLAFSTDSYTVDPIFFPGGDIGELAINGTVNDLAMRGAVPKYLSVGFIMEEGLSLSDFRKILASMKQAADYAGVQIVTGDTKVVPRNAADKIFINTSGIGIIAEKVSISGKKTRPGDKVIISGTIGDHGITVLTQRESMQFDTELRSDTAALNHLVAEMIAVSEQIHTLRDPTRGGVATTLNEIARQSQVGIMLHENNLPIRDDVNAACEMLGLDPLYLANEGKLLACVAASDAEKVLAVMRRNEHGREAVIIGEVTGERPGKVFLKTGIGGTRIIDMLAGEPLPRIC